MTPSQAPGPSSVGQLCALPCGLCQQQDLCILPRPMAKRCVQAAAELMDGCLHVSLLTASHGLKRWDQGSQRHRRGAIWSCGSAACWRSFGLTCQCSHHPRFCESGLPPSMIGCHASCLQLRESDVQMPRPHCEIGCYSIMCFGMLKPTLRPRFVCLLSCLFVHITRQCESCDACRGGFGGPPALQWQQRRQKQSQQRQQQQRWLTAAATRSSHTAAAAAASAAATKTTRLQQEQQQQRQRKQPVRCSIPVGRTQHPRRQVALHCHRPETWLHGGNGRRRGRS